MGSVTKGMTGWDGLDVGGERKRHGGNGSLAFGLKRMDSDAISCNEEEAEELIMLYLLGAFW